MPPQSAPWITFRPQLKVLDCTIRDGGLINKHQFTDELVRAVYETCVAAGVDYMEVGYKASPRLHSRSEYGPTRFTDEEWLNKLFADHDAAKTGLKLTVMADAGKCDWQEQIVPCAESKIDMIRVAFYAHQVSEAVQMIEHCHKLGYETSANLMAVTNIQEVEIDTVLDAIGPTPAQTMCIVDSFGHMYREQIAHLYTKYTTALKGTGKEIGIHAHNNMQLAFANSIEAIILGANRIDATMGGLGRGAGNCHMELLLGFLRNPKFKLRPVIRLLQDHIEPLKATVEWGPLIPYNITGQMNLHPRAAMEFRDGDEKDDFVKFYDQIAADI
jgi:4-hydroxy 2-oxovalerate aldolase